MGRPEIINAKLHKTKHYFLHGFSDPSEAEGTEEENLRLFAMGEDEIKKWIVDEFVDLKRRKYDYRCRLIVMLFDELSFLFAKISFDLISRVHFFSKTS